MRNNVLIWVGVFVFVSVSVGAYLYFKSDQPPLLPPPTEGEDTVVLAVGEEKRFGDIILTLEKIERDTRCPIDVQCATAGELTARLSVRSGTESMILAASTIDNAQWFAGHFITISESHPAAYSNRAIAQQEYRLQFRLTPGERPLSLVTVTSDTELQPDTQTASTSATTSVEAIVAGDYTEGEREMRRVVDERYGLVFSYRLAPLGYVMVAAEEPTGKPVPLMRYELYPETEFETYMNATATVATPPPSIRVSVFANPEQKTGEEWARANPDVAYTSQETRFIPLTAAGQPAFLYNATGPYPMSNLLIAYEKYIYLVTGFYRERTEPIYRDFDIVTQSLSFLINDPAPPTQ